MGTAIGPVRVGVCVLCACWCARAPVPRMCVLEGARGKCVSEQMLEATPACPSSSWRLEDPAAAGIKVVFHLKWKQLSPPPSPSTHPSLLLYPPTTTPSTRHPSSPSHGPLQRRTNDIKGAGSCRHIGTCVRCSSCEIERLQIYFSSFILSVAAEYLKRLYHRTIHQNICVGCRFFSLSNILYTL